MITPYVAAIVQTDSRHKPTPSPLSSPIVVSSLAACVATIANGLPLPACWGQTSFPEVIPSDVYRRVIPASAQADSASGAMVRAYFAPTGSVNDTIYGLTYGNGISQLAYSVGRPLYIAKTSDPLAEIRCTMYCNFGNPVAYVPAHAIPQGSSDRHMSILQPDNTLVDTWVWGPIIAPFFSGETVSAASVSITTIDGTPYSVNDEMPGFMIDAVTAGGMVDGAGEITLAELQAGIITHELYGVLPCVSANWFPPATQHAFLCSDGRAAIPNGALLRYALTDAQITASAMSPESKIIARAAHDYGIRVADTSGDPGLSVQVEPQESFWSYGSGSDPFISYALLHSWSHVTNASASPPVNRYVHALNDMNLPANLIVLASGN